MPEVQRHPPFSPSLINRVIQGCTFVAPWLVLGAPLPVLAQSAAAPSAALASTPSDIVPGERLSAWLARHSIPADAYFSGLSWQVPEETVRQHALKQQLMLQAAASTGSDGQPLTGLVEWLRSLPVTGRVGLGIPDTQWLAANPAQDPILRAGESVYLPRRPQTVSMLLESGQLCQVQHQAGATVWQYIQACSPEDASQRDVAWLVQPDGSKQRLGVGIWNAQAAQTLAPGAWIWAPSRQSQVAEALSDRLVGFLATQGVAADQQTVGTRARQLALPPQSQAPSARSRDLALTANDWGEVGLLQTPSARMAEAGNMRFHLSHVVPYTRATVMFQPFDWLEGGFRYTDIADRDYGRNITSQSYKDKSIDLKVRLWQESRYLPEVASGARDIGGTGLFSGEYVVASKRTGNFDWSLGLGWGYIGARGDLSNPLSIASDRFSHRPPGSAGAGNFKFNLFRGRTSPFGGVQWQTPWTPLVLKLEYEGNDYRDEPATKAIRQSSPFNFGATYRVNKVLDISAGIERGNRFMIGLTLNGNLARMHQPKSLDAPMPAINPQPPTAAADWNATAQSLAEQTDWNVRAIGQRGHTLHVDVEDNGAVLRTERVQRAMAVLNQNAPADVQYFSLDFSNHGLALDSQTVNRQDWVWRHTTASYPSQRGSRGQPYSLWRRQGGLETLRARSWLTIQRSRQDDAVARQGGPAATPLASDPGTPASTPPTAIDNTRLLWLPSPLDKRLQYGFGPSFWQSFGGPDSFMLYQLGVQGSAQLRLTKNTFISGALNYRVVDNYDKFKYTAPSKLPRVRTYSREYVTTSRLTISNLQVNHFMQLSPTQFASVYAGLLESMYAGVGGEWLYRPVASRWAFGVDLNRVKQRGFDQHFSMRDYTVNTGHATVYWDTGWNGVLAQVSAGQYLAGDKGATVDISKRFDNGIVLGAWVTKTNVSSSQFGEGSFDKGIYLTIPFDHLLPKSSASTGYFAWQPLLRDGGAKLNRAWQLYPMTSTRDSRAFQYAPWVPEEDRLTAPQSGQDLQTPLR